MRSVGERFKLTVNGVQTELEASGDTPLLYALRNGLALKGTRFGCGSGQCGACFVLIDGHAAPACDSATCPRSRSSWSTDRSFPQWVRERRPKALPQPRSRMLWTTRWECVCVISRSPPSGSSPRSKRSNAVSVYEIVRG